MVSDFLWVEGIVQTLCCWLQVSALQSLHTPAKEGLELYQDLYQDAQDSAAKGFENWCRHTAGSAGGYQEDAYYVCIQMLVLQ